MHLQPKFTFKKHPHIPFFRIFYSTTFTLLTLLLIAAVLISPGDHIYQSFHSGEIYHIFIVAGFYLLTLIAAILIYGGRLYATRSALASIPREWSGGDGKGVGIHLGKVGKVVQSGLERSAWVAYEARPRDLKQDKGGRVTAERLGVGVGVEAQRKSEDSEQNVKPTWGIISHPGWSSPSSPDLPNLHYEPVILELPHLIEAKAVSLAPPDPLYELPADEEAGVEEPPLPDPFVVSILQRPASMGLRDYITHLTNLTMVNPPDLGAEFLTIYEQARFSGEELNEIEFRGLMSVFAEILRNMTPLDQNLVDSLHAEADYASSSEGISAADSDGASFATNGTVNHTPQPEIWATPRPDIWTSESDSSISRTGSQGTIHTAPSRPGAARNNSNISRATRASIRRGVRTPSMPSLRPVRSQTSSVGGHSARSVAGSVIRLAEARTELDLPYEFVTGDEDR